MNAWLSYGGGLEPLSEHDRGYGVLVGSSAIPGAAGRLALQEDQNRP